MTEPGHLDPDLGSLECRLDLDKDRISHGKSSEAFFSCVQSRACPFDINLFSKFGIVGQNGHDIVFNLSEPTAYG